MPSTRPSLLILAAAAGLFAVFALAAGALAGAQYAIPIVILAAIVLAFLAFDGLLARRSLDRHDGDARAAQDDGGDDLPAAEPLIPDGRPLGDTAQAHDETSPPRPGEGLARATRGRGAGGAARRNDAWSGAVLEEERPEDA